MNTTTNQETKEMLDLFYCMWEENEITYKIAIEIKKMNDFIRTGNDWQVKATGKEPLQEIAKLMLDCKELNKKELSLSLFAFRDYTKEEIFKTAKEESETDQQLKAKLNKMLQHQNELKENDFPIDQIEIIELAHDTMYVYQKVREEALVEEQKANKIKNMPEEEFKATMRSKEKQYVESKIIEYKPSLIRSILAILIAYSVGALAQRFIMPLVDTIASLPGIYNILGIIGEPYYYTTLIGHYIVLVITFTVCMLITKQADHQKSWQRIVLSLISIANYINIALISIEKDGYTGFLIIIAILMAISLQFGFAISKKYIDRYKQL